MFIATKVSSISHELNKKYLIEYQKIYANLNYLLVDGGNKHPFCEISLLVLNMNAYYCPIFIWTFNSMKMLSITK